MRFVLAVLLFFMSMYTHGQSSIILKGRVLNDSIEKASLNVVNISMQRGAITDADGAFRIQVRLRDTINISAVQYESRQFIVSDKIFRDQRVALYLVPKITALENVNISNLDLTGDLNTDASETKERPFLLPTDLGLQENTAPKRTTEERRLYTGTTRGSDQVGRYNPRFDIPLAGVINALTGKTKRLKKHIAVSNYNNEVTHYREQFSDDFYIIDCGIPKELIEDFVFYAIDDESLPSTDKQDRLNLFAFYRAKAKKYLVLKAQEQPDNIPKN